jgi:hypothetical protein
VCCVPEQTAVCCQLCLLKGNSSDTWRAKHVTTVKAGVSVWVLVKSVNPASKRNRYHKYFLGAKGGRCLRLTIFFCRLSFNLAASTSCNPQGLSRPLQELLYLYLYLYLLLKFRTLFWDVSMWFTSSTQFSKCANLLRFGAKFTAQFQPFGRAFCIHLRGMLNHIVLSATLKKTGILTVSVLRTSNQVIWI